MKTFAYFFGAGLATMVLFSVPAFEQVAFLYAGIGFGPAFLFAVLLVHLAQRSLSKTQIVGVGLCCLFAYWCGEFFDVQLGLRHGLGPGIDYIAPGVGAAVLLVGLIIVKWRFPDVRSWLSPLVLGTVVAFLSAIPLWLTNVSDVPNYPCWGAHIMIWYAGVGPFAVAILSRETSADRVGPLIVENPNHPASPPKLSTISGPPPLP
jgi:hypothetical protein